MLSFPRINIETEELLEVDGNFLDCEIEITGLISGDKGDSITPPFYSTEIDGWRVVKLWETDTYGHYFYLDIKQLTPLLRQHLDRAIDDFIMKNEQLILDKLSA